MAQPQLLLTSCLRGLDYPTWISKAVPFVFFPLVKVAPILPYNLQVSIKITFF